LRRFVPLALAGLCLAAAPAHAQRGRGPDLAPRRPVLGAAADTNSAMGYYAHGLNTINREPAEAAASFYWASRLNPGWSDALYGEYVARLLMDKDRLVDYMRGQRSTLRLREIQHIDSLYAQARTIDPFMVRRFDQVMLRTWLQTWAENTIRRDNPAGGDAAAIAHWIDTTLMQGDDYLRAWLAASEGRNESAVTAYERAIQQSRHRSGLRADLARVQYHMGTLPAALASMQQAITEWRKEDAEDRIIILYQNKAVLEHSVGVIHEARQDVAAAREAYGRALQEDIAYYPAHQRLSALALAAGDTASAISEMDLAVQLAPENPTLHMSHGMLLAGALRYDEALKEFEKAREINPDYAAPHFVIARMYDGSGMREEAIAAYRAWMSHASRTEPQMDPVRQRVEQLAAEIAAERAAAAAPQPAAAPATPPPARP